MCQIIAYFFSPPPLRGFAGEEEEQQKTQVEIRAEIDQHLKDKVKVETTIPQHIIIGPFYINTDTTRLALAKKHKDIALALLSYLAESLHKITEEVGVLLSCVLTLLIRSQEGVWISESTLIKILYISKLTPGTNRSLVSFTSLVISSDNVNRGLVLFLLLCLIYKPGHN